MKVEDFYSEIHKRYGNITRARGPFLYTQKNVRLTDLNQEGGRAILGWDAPSYTVFKNVMTKGLVGSFDCAYRGQLQRAVSELLNSKRKISFFCHKKDAMQAALVLDPKSTSVFKPFSGVDYSGVKNVIIAPPLPWTNNFWILAANGLGKDKDSRVERGNDSAENGGLERGQNVIAGLERGQNVIAGLDPAILPSEKFPPALIAAAARAVYDLIAAIKVRQEKDFFIYDKVLTKFFERRSCWLRPKVPQEKYDDFVLACLDAGVLVNPDYNADSLVPFGADKGVLKKMGEINV
ncbi:MAG: hypothetical protein J6V90_12880 [Treponema sp.]|nr:hypothetical protein [Treponema sp.]